MTLYTYAATIINVVDADTFDVVIDLGFEVSIKQRLRLQGIDTPERKTSEGRAAQAFLLSLIEKHGRGVTVNTKSKEKYGRWLAKVVLSGDIDLATELIAQGYGKTYFGGKR